VIDRKCDDLVVAQDLGGALCPADAVGHEDNGVAALARLAKIGGPVTDAAAKLERRLT
jgi:hypothetical protein